MPNEPSEREIWFARKRRQIADAIQEFSMKPIEDHGFEVVEGGTNIDTPSGHLEENTLRGQEMKDYCVFRDNSGQEYRVDFVIGHSEDWDVILDTFTSVGGPRQTLILKDDSAVANGVEDLRRSYFNLIERIKRETS